MMCNPAKCAMVQLVVLACVGVGAAALHFNGATEQRELIDGYLASTRAQTPSGAAQQPAPAPSGNDAATTTNPATSGHTGNGQSSPPNPDPDKAFSIDDLGEMITVEQAVKLYNLPYEDPDAPQVIFLDAREREKYLQAHIPMAYHITPQSFFDGTLPEDMDYWAKDSIIVVYCSGGHCDASHLVETRLKQQKSFTRVHVMGDGLPGWQALGLPTESGPPSN